MNSSIQPNDPNPAQAALQRRAVLGSVAVAALLGGAAASWLRFRTDTSSPMDLAALWDSSFESPSGKIVQWSQFRGRPLIINFWATWCTPCVEEMPLIDRFYTENASKGWQVIGLAIDQPSKVKSFLEQHPVSYSVLLAGLGGTELAKALGNDVGALPYTIVLGADERVLFKKIGKLRQEELSSLN